MIRRFLSLCLGLVLPRPTYDVIRELVEGVEDGSIVLPEPPPEPPAMIPPALLAAVLDRPGDDTPRLAAADRLDDLASDLPDPQAARDRAELIRVQCELSRMPDPPPEPSVGMRSASREQRLAALMAWKKQWAATYYPLRGRERVLLAAHWCHWRPPAECGTYLCTNLAGEPDGWAAVDAGVTFRRGFVARVVQSLASWQQHAPALLAAHPLERAEVADVPGLVFTVEPPGEPDPRSVEGWSLYARFAGLEWFSGRYPRAELVGRASGLIPMGVDYLRGAAGDRWPGEIARRWPRRPPADGNGRDYSGVVLPDQTIGLGEPVDDLPHPSA